MKTLILTLALILILSHGISAHPVLDFLLLSIVETDSRQTEQWGYPGPLREVNPILTDVIGTNGQQEYFEGMKHVFTQKVPIWVKVTAICVKLVNVLRNDQYIRNYEEFGYQRTIAIEYRWTF